MDEVKRMVAAGVRIPAAVREALARNGLHSVSDFAKKYQLSRASAANHINGIVRATDETLGALSQELGGTPDEWAELLWLAAKPQAQSA